IDEDAWTRSLELKGLGMGGELCLALNLAIGGADRRDRTVAVPDVHALARGVISHVISIVSQRCRPCDVIVGAVEPLHVASLSVSHRDALRVRNDLKSLRLVEPRNTLRDSARLEIDNFHRVVSERGD